MPIKHFFLLRLIAKYKYYESLNSDKILIAEESFIHWHLVMHELLLNNNLKLTSDCKKDIGLLPKAIIYCYADEETLLERIKLREKSKKINHNHRGKDYQVILQSVVKKQNVFSQYTMIAETMGVNVLQLNTADDIEKNTKRINPFLKSLQ